MPLVLSGSTGIAGVDGSASTPAVQGTDTNTGIAFPAADTVAIGTGGTERMRVDSSGNVGIGTSSPNQKLDVKSTIRASGPSAGSIDMSHDGINGGITNNTGGMLFYANGSAAGNIMVWHTNSAERMRIENGGNVGIGTSSPGSLLTVNGNLAFNSGYGSAAVAYGCRAWVNFNGTGTVAIRASGNVSSITDSGTGQYTVNFTNAMPDANYSAVASLSHYAAVTRLTIVNVDAPSTSSIALLAVYGDPWGHYDPTEVYLSIFR